MYIHTLPDRAVDRWLVKMRHIMPTLVLILVISVAGLTLLRWLSVKLGLELKTEFWELWIPIGFPLIAILIWLRPKTRIIVDKKGGDPDRPRWAFQLFAWMIMLGPLVSSQFYMSYAMGSMLDVKDVSEINSKPLSEYYTIRNFSVDTTHLALGEDISTSGKYNQYLDIRFFFVVPITMANEPADMNNRVVWYGVKYSHQIDNKDSEAIKEEKYNEFYAADLNNITHYNFHDLDYFKRTPNSGNLEGFVKAIVRINTDMGKNPIVLEPVKGSFEERTGSTLAWMLGMALGGLVLISFLIMGVTYDPLELGPSGKDKTKIRDEIKEYVMYLVPTRERWVTPIIMDICILMLLIMTFSGVSLIQPTTPELMWWGANRRQEVLDGQWWRLVTSMFLHGGIIHLVFNMYGLMLGSLFLEIRLRPVLYATLYVVSGIAGSLASIWWHPATASVGASGAIFGLFGANLALTLTNFYTGEGKKGALIMFLPFVAINLVMGFASVGIDNAAHIGGLVAGFIIGFVMFKTTDLNGEDVPQT